MVPKIRNIIIFIAIAAIFVLIYIFFIKSSPDQGSLVSTPSSTSDVDGSEADTNIPNETPLVAQDFLMLLLNVKNIKLDDAIFFDAGFNSLHDSSITLTPDGNEGRPNPFAQFGNDNIPTPQNTANTLPVLTIPPTLPPLPTTPTTY